MLLTVCGAAFELADDSCQQDFDGEECHVVPDDAFQKLSDALDEIENTLPTEDTDRPDVFLVWSAVPRAALKSILHAQPAPVVPDEIKHRIGGLDWGWEGEFNRGWNACRAAMLQAEPVCTCPSGDGSLRWPCPVHPGSSPVIPDGYVMVPKEPTEAMMLHNSGCQHHAWDDPDCAMRQTRRLIWSHMLAAAPQEVK
ncbi:hypothetical protein AB9D10_25090 [Klebsiella pneumoniae]|nr:hypothetical protein [Klebsiella pneumoniae]